MIRPRSTLRALLEAAARLRRRGETEADRQFIGALLSRIASGEDVREEFFENDVAAGRRKDDDGGRRELVAFVYHGCVRLGWGKHGKELRGKVARFSGLTDSQVEHAAREAKPGKKRNQDTYGTQAKAFVDQVEPPLLRRLMGLWARRLRRLRPSRREN